MERRRLLSTEFTLPVSLLILTTIYLAETFRLRSQMSEAFWEGPRAMPVLASILMYALLLIVLVRQFRSAGTAPAEGSAVRPLLVTIATAIYILAFEPLGYGLSTILFVSALFVIFDFKRRQPVSFVIHAVAVTGIFYVLYAILFGVRLPELYGII
jgi:putative tricarboxylic transport membrane protein